MRFYTNQHQFYCGIDLHARSMYICILSYEGEILVHRNMKAAPEPFLKAVAPYREGLVVAVECIFTWYWLADLCAQEDIPFVLGHALYGVYPNLALNGPDDADSGSSARGRWIPTTSVEQYAATLATWYGLSSADLSAVFPLIGRFASSNLGFLA